MKRAFIFGLLVVAALWPAFVNGGAFWFPDTSNYIRGADAAVVAIADSPSEWSDRINLVVTGADNSSIVGASGPDAGASAQTEPSRVIYSGRSIYYGFMMYVPMRLGGTWAAIILQSVLACGLVIYSLRLALRDKVNNAEETAFLILAGIIALTPFGYYVSMLMPDIYSGLAILTLAVLMAMYNRLSLWEKSILLGATAIMATFHSTIFLLCLVIGAIGLLLAIARMISWRGVSSIIPVAAIAMAAGIAFNFGVESFARQSPISPPFLSARLTSAGPGVELLKQDCSEASTQWEICGYLDRLPQPSDAFLWSQRAEKGVFQLADVESKRTMAEQDKAFFFAVLLNEPAGVLNVSIRSTFEQLASFSLVNFNYPQSRVQQLYDQYPKNIAEDIERSRAANNTMPTGFTVLSSILVSLASVGVLLFLALNYKRLDIRREDVALIAVVLLAFLANAAICGALSGPHARYQMRLLWLLPTAASILAFCWVGARNRSSQGLAQEGSS